MRFAKRPKSEDGASAVEYSLIVALIAAVIVIAVVSLGGITSNAFTGACESVDSGVVAAGGTPASC